MLAVAGGKGGCGKTTTTLALASAIARRGGGAIAVDGDVDMPDLHVEAGTRATPDAGDIVAGQSPERVAQRSVEYPGVDVVAAPVDSRHLAPVAASLRDRPEWVIVDTAAGASRDVARALSVADRSVLVSTPTRESLLDTAKTAAFARSLDAPPVGTVLTRSDGSVDPSPLLHCPTLCHVPAVSHPGRSEVVRSAYASCLSAITKRNV